MSDFNDIDDLVSARMRAAAGHEPDLYAAHAQVQRRVTRARRRRTTVIAGSAGVSVLMLGAAYAMSTDNTRELVTSAEAPTTISLPGDEISIAASSTSLPTDSVVASSTAAPEVASTTTSNPADPATTATNTSVDNSVTSSTLGDGGDGDRVELFDVTVPADETFTLSGVGGAVDVRIDAQGLSFASYPVAAPGFVAAVTKGEPDELEVTFTSSTHRTRVRVRVDRDRLRADRSETALSTTSTIPGPATTADDDGPDDGPDDGDDDGSGDGDRDRDNGGSGRSGSGKGESGTDSGDAGRFEGGGDPDGAEGSGESGSADGADG